MPRTSASRAVAGLVVLVTSGAACDAPVRDASTPQPPVAVGAPTADDGALLPAHPPTAPTGPVQPEVLDALEHRFWLTGRPRDDDLATIRGSGDVRLAWPLVDLLRFEEDGPLDAELRASLQALTGATPPAAASPWVWYQDLLLAWDVPAPPDYRRFKHAQHRLFDQNFDPFFEDVDADLDWREVSWGGVPAGGIAELVDPLAVGADEPGARWVREDDVVFGLVVDGEARAYPRIVLDVHELVMDDLGGTRIALSHCTLCGVATAWDADVGGFVDAAGTVRDEPLHLATSGLLQRSNKLMFDRATNSMFHQFDGVAVAGPLRAQGIALASIPIDVVTWAQWRAAHPETTVLARPLPADRNLGDPYDGTFLDDRPDRPIFPTGPVDDRLGPHVEVVGVRTARGVAVAFPVDDALAALTRGGEVTEAGVALALGADGAPVAREVGGGPPLPVTRAFWFAWSQFREDTRLWTP